MADKSDVEVAFVNLIDATLYPNGDGSPSATGAVIRIYRGWPNSDQLDADLLLGIAHVTVTEQAGYSRQTDGYFDPETTFPGTPTITVSVSGPSVTIAGTPGLGQLVGVVVAGLPYAYACLASDTLATAAAGVAAMVAGATSTGATVTFPTTRPITARTGTLGSYLIAPRWQVQGFKVTIWASTPAIRDTLSKLIDPAIANTSFLPMPDGLSARIQWRNTYSDDCPQKELLWKRDIFYTAQFATTISIAAGQVMLPIINTTAQSTSGANLAPPIENAS